MRTLWVITACTILLGPAIGCGHSLYALPDADQQIAGKDRWIVQQTDDLRVAVLPVPVPWDSDGALIGFRAEIVNLTGRPIAVEYRDFALLDAEGYRRVPLDPQRLDEALALADVPPDLRFAVARGYGRHRSGHRGHSYRRHSAYYGGYGRGCYSPYSYGWGYGYGYGGYPYGYDPYFGGFGYYGYYGYDPEIARERSKQFVGSLWRDEILDPNQVATGHVVFAYRPDDDEIIILEVAVHPLVLVVDTATPPTLEETPPSSPGPFKFRFEYR